MKIETEVKAMTVEIDDVEYEVAPRTIGIVDKLTEIEKEYKDKPSYKLMLAELEVLLGAPACASIFCDGKNENVDRIQLIFNGVAQAFNYHHNAAQQAMREKQMSAVATTLSPLNEMLRGLNELERGKGVKGAHSANIKPIFRPGSSF